MPALGGLHLFIAIMLAVHAMKTGRPTWWLFILLFVPGIGSLAYAIVEIVPAILRSRAAHKVTANIGTIVDPGREWRERVKHAELVDSADAKRSLAEECEKRGMWDDAIRLYEAAATGLFSDDSALLTGLARARLAKGQPAEALAEIEKLRAANPKMHSQEAHLLYARALEGVGRRDDALAEYDEVAKYYAGFEARARYGLLLVKEGHLDEARQIFQDVVRASGVRPAVVTSTDKEWLKVAKAQLR